MATTRLAKIVGHIMKNDTNQSDVESVYDLVSDYYGKTLKSSKDLKTNACTTSGKPSNDVINAIKNIPDEILSKYYGCGVTTPNGINGLTVLDLGCGTGRDCYIASQFVGENGNVIGIDMTDEQLNVAKKYTTEFCKNKMGYKRVNLKFIKGYIECLDKYIENNSIDICISNCVINLSPKKDAVLKGVWNALKYGGEFYFSDVYCDVRLNDTIKNNPILYGECLAGALYIEDFRRLCQKIGFLDPRIIKIDRITVNNNELKDILGNANFYSITYRLFKLRDIEDKCEDYGQIAVYNGNIKGNKHFYDLDDHHRFYTNKPMLVCGNTAQMVGDTWLKPYFNVVGNMKTHYGLFDCSPVTPKTNANNDDTNAACAPGACC